MYPSMNGYIWLLNDLFVLLSFSRKDKVYLKDGKISPAWLLPINGLIAFCSFENANQYKIMIKVLFGIDF
jgi:hypothetical protein